MSENLFIGGGDMGALMRAYDWAQTSLGSVENWSESLKTTISILLNAPYPMFLVWQGNSDARLLFYNDASASVFDKSGDLIPLGQSISQDWAKGWGKLRSHIEQVFTTGQPLRHENEQVPHDQDDNFGGRSYTWSYTPICDETGQVSGVLVTGYKVLPEIIQPALSNQSFDSIKEKLQRREEQLSLITNALPVLIAYIDKNHYYQFNNQTYETWFGQTAANLTGKHVREVLGESAYESVRPYMELALSGEQVTFESQISYLEGGTRYIRADYVPHINSQGEVEGYFSLVSDISEQQAALRERQQAEAALHHSEAQLRLLTNSLPVLIAYVDHQQYYRFVNQTYTDWFNLHPQEIIGKHVKDILGQEAYQTIKPDIETVLSGQKVSSEKYVFFKTAGWRYVQRYFVPELGEDGTVRGYYALVIDVTERTRAEAALRQSEERLRLTMAGAQMGTWDVDLLTGQAIWSEQHFTMLGYEPVTTGEATEEMWMSRIYPDDLERVIQEWQQSRQENRFYRTEYRVIRADNGEISWLAALGNFTYDRNGQAIRSIGVLFDISDRKRDEAERKQAEAALRESEERFRLVTHAVNGLVFDWNLQTNEVYRSEKLYQLVGIKPEDAPPSASWWQERIHPVDYARLQSQAIEMFNSGNPLYEAEYRVLHADGHWVEVWERGCLIRDQQGQVIRLVGSTVDITERKRTEQALRQAEERLRVALQNAPITVFNQDCELKYTWLHNPVLYDLNEMIGKGDRDFLPPEDAEILMRVKQRVLETGIGTREEIKLTRNETNYYYDLTVEPLRDVNNTIVGITCAAIDISRLKQTEINLRESEARFRGVVESNMVGILFWEASGCITDANEKAVQMLGYSREELQSKQVQWQDITPPEFHELDAAMVAQILATGICPPFEKAYIRKDGTKVPILIGCGLLPGYSDRGVAYFIDISERKQAAEALRESEERLQIALKGANLGTWNYDLTDGKLIWSDRCKAMFGLPVEVEMNYALFLEAVHPEDRQQIDQAVTQAIAQQQDYDVEMRTLGADGTLHWVRSIGRVYRNQQGLPVRMAGVALDITARKQAEAALHQSEERLRLAQRAAGAGLWDWDIVNNHVTWSEEYYQIYGLDATVTPSYDTWLASILAPDREQADQATREALAHRTNLNVEFRILHPTQGICWISAIGQTFCDADGQPKRMTGIVLNITNRKQAEAEREQLLAREQVARQEAERANRIKDEFLAVLSHELRSPLNPILGWSKLLQSRRLDAEKTAQALAVIERNAKLQSELIEDLLDVSRILQGKLRLNVVNVDLAATIKSAMETVRLAAEAKSIQIQQQLDFNIAPVFGDSARLQQVVWNLLSNAVKFTPQGGQVDVRLEQHGHQAQITVSDTGKGIAADFLPYVFDYFRQADGTTTRKFGGLGLGLAIVRHLVELHGGTVEAESLGEGQGATFTVRLPLIANVPQISQNHQSSKLSVDLSGVQILLADDDTDTREFVAFLLEQAGARVVTSKTASEAFAILMRSQPDVLVSDIGMPDMDGYMLMQQVRALLPEQGGQIPAIALTAYAGDFNQQQALQAGFQHHISKPVEPDILLRAIVNLIKHS